MPVLSLPLSLTGTLGTPPSVWFPLRIPFTMIPRIGSILPASINGPFKSGLMALFRLAWSNKIQLPLLITVCFMAFDIRLQLEINIFWEPPRPTAARQQRDRAQRIANANYEAIRAAAVNAALLQRQRQRQYLEELARHEHEMRHAMMRHASDNEDDGCGFSTSEEDEAEDELEEETSNKNGAVKSEATKESLKSKAKKKKRKSDEEDEEDEDEEAGDDDDDDESEDSDDDDESGSGASQNPQPDYFGDSDRDDDDFYEGRGGDRSGDESDDSDSTGGVAPLVVELEIRQRSSGFWSTTNKVMSSILPTTTMFFRGNVQQHLTSCHVPSCDKSSDAGLLKWNSAQMLSSPSVSVQSV